MNYSKGYLNSYSQPLTQQPRGSIIPDTRSRVQFNVHHLNTSEAKYWNNRKDDISIDNSPNSSHSINTPIKFSNSLNRPNSKETFSNKIEQPSYSKFSNKNNDNLNMNIPLEKSISIESNNSRQNYGMKSTKINDKEEEKYTNPYNFKKKEDSIYSGSQENSIFKKSSESLMKKDSMSMKKYKFPYQPKMQSKREMAGLRNIGNTCFL